MIGTLPQIGKGQLAGGNIIKLGSIRLHGGAPAASFPYHPPDEWRDFRVSPVQTDASLFDCAIDFPAAESEPRGVPYFSVRLKGDLLHASALVLANHHRPHKGRQG